MFTDNYDGSTWKKWDLHIHTVASDGKGTPEDIINAAVNEGMSVIAITDHHTTRSIDEAKRIGKEKGITVISGIEFRTEYGKESVHMIGLFPDKYNEVELNQKALEEVILNPLGLSRTLIVAKGRENNPALDEEAAFRNGWFHFQVDFKKASDLIHQYGGIVTVHSGDKSNSIEEMKHDGPGKTNVRDVVDSLGPVKEELLNNYIDICEKGSFTNKNIDFYLKNFNKPVIAASDAHKVRRVGKVFSWIKADATFEGLKQIKYEPEQRVRIQENIPDPKSDYQVIDSVIINHPDFGEQTIPFNNNLNAIIGGRSSGKSILLGCIAKLSNYYGEIKKDNPEYNSYIDEVSSNMQVIWKDKTENNSRKVEYFPQSYINSLASKSDKTVKLIEDILKGDDARKIAFETYEASISKNISEVSNLIEILNKLEYRKKENKKDAENIGDLDGINKEIIKLSKEVDDIKGKITNKLSEEEEDSYLKLKEEKTEKNCIVEQCELAEQQLINLKNAKLFKDLSGELIGLPEDVKNDFIIKLEDIERQIQKEWHDFIEKQMEKNTKQILELKKRIEEILNSSEYIKGESYYKENAAITQLNKLLEGEKNKKKKIDELMGNTLELDQEIQKNYSDLIKCEIMYKTKADELAQKISMERDDVKIYPKVTFDDDAFKEFVDSTFNKKSTMIKNLMEYVYESETSFCGDIEKLYQSILRDEVSIKGARDKKQVILEMFTTNFYKITYNVEYQNDNLESMSEGKKAFVILRMLLDFNENTCPILIDQPEDDLDNRAIYNDLVAYIRNKKKERQIILVTHNPNIVVTADAEEVIVANQNGIHNENKDGVRFEYRSGSIENTYKTSDQFILYSQGIREHICDILEGGDVAFIKRENKYDL